MTISATCQHCNHSLQVPDSYAGQAGPCPRCRNTLLIPSSTARSDHFKTLQLGPSASTPQNSQSPHSSSAKNSLCQQIEDALLQARQSDPLFSPLINLALRRGELLGEGGMGAVYRVHDDRLHRDAALKVLQKSALRNNAIPRFLREAHLMARLDHPAIPPVFEYGTTTQGEHFLLMRLIRGQTLSEKIKTLHKFSKNLPQLNQLIEVLIKVSEAIAYAHSQKILHRDLKPDNIMVGEFGEVMVMDWGLARDLNESDDQLSYQPSELDQKIAAKGLTLAGAIMGTPGYMPPEQARGETLDERADIFALGAILTEILTNHSPISGQSSEILIVGTLDGRIKTPREIRPDIPRELNSIAAHALAFNPEHRTPSAQHFAQDLRAWLSGQEIPSHHYGLLDQTLRAARKHTAALIISTLFASLLAAAGALWAALEQQKRQALQTQEKLREEALARNRAEEEKKKIDDQLTQAEALRAAESLRAQNAQLVLTQLNQAQDLARRGASRDSIRPLLDAVLSLTERSYESLMAAANIYDQARLIQEQTTLLREAVDRHPPAYQALFLLHTIELKQSSKTSFVMTGPLQKLLTEARSRRDENEFTLFAEACAAERSKNLKKALELLDKVESYTTRWSWPIVNRAAILSELGDKKDALRNYNRAIELDPAMAMAYANRGSLHSELGDIKAALSDYNKAIELEPHLAPPYNNRGTIYEKLGDFSAALRDYDQAIALDPYYPYAYSNRGKLYGDSGNPEAALKDLNKAMELDPTAAHPYNNRGKVLCGTNKNQALRDFNKAIELDPSLASAYDNRGNLRSELGDSSGALRDYDKAIELTPNNFSAFCNRGTLRHRLGDDPGALSDFNRAIEANPKYAMAYNNRGTLRRQQGDKPGALSDYNKAIEADPNLALAYSNRASLLREMGDLNASLSDFNKAIELNPKDAFNYNERAVLCRQMGDKISALKDFNHSIKLDPNFSLPYANRGDLLGEQGRLPEAIQDLTQFLELSPQHPNAPQIRELLNQLQRKFSKQP